MLIFNNNKMNSKFSDGREFNDKPELILHVNSVMDLPKVFYDTFDFEQLGLNKNDYSELSDTENEMYCKTWDKVLQNAKTKDGRKLYNKEGGLFLVGENFQTNEYAKRSTVGDCQIELESYVVDVYEDDYEQGKGDKVNSFSEKSNKIFKTQKDFFDYIYAKTTYKDIDAAPFFGIEDGIITTRLLVDNGNSPATQSQIEGWKKGEQKLYTANYSFHINLGGGIKANSDYLEKILFTF
jgi:hypothetical protein